ncbi:MAG: rhodanese-like domain-containing protein, partial [Bacteroidota bacterium]|nr:rhodanese-like domain-containing protein [Bacteroidota bacterium]
NEFQRALEKGDAILIDVRTPQEFASGHIPGSINIDWSGADYESSFARLDPERPVLLYCAMGGRSDQARSYLAEKGFEAYDLDEGIISWKAAGLPVEK